MGVSIAVAFAVSGSAAARTATDDLSVRVHFVRDSVATTTSSLANDIQFDIFTDGPAQTVTMRYSLPAGLTFGDDVPDPTENCTNGAPVVCTIDLTPNNSLQASWSWPVIAAAPGTYSITTTVEGTRIDSVPGNNSVTFAYEIKPADAGAASVAVSAPKAAPVKPKAGEVVTFTSTVRVDGLPAQPSTVTCAAKLGGKTKAATPRSTTGTASCRCTTKKADKGKTLSGSMRVTAGGRTIAKRFVAMIR